MPDVKISELPSAGPLTGDELLLISQSGVDYSVALSRLLDVPEPAAPSAFTSGLWTATAGDEQISVVIVSLPSAGSEPITDIEYRLDGGSWISTGDITDFDITSLTNDVEYDVEIRAVNAVGAGAASDVKARTPSSGSGEITYSVLGATTANPWPGTSVSGTINVGAAAANKHVYAIFAWEGENSLSAQTLNGSGMSIVAYVNDGDPYRHIAILRSTSPGSGSVSYSFSSSTWLGSTVLRWFAVFDGGSTETDTDGISLGNVAVDRSVDATEGGLVIYGLFSNEANPITLTGFEAQAETDSDSIYFTLYSGVRTVSATGTVDLESSVQVGGAGAQFVAVSIPPA